MLCTRSLAARVSAPVSLSLAIVCGVTALHLANRAEAQTTVTQEKPSKPQSETPQAKATDKVLRHAVFFKFKDTAAAKDIDSVVQAFRALPSKLDVIKEFHDGENNSQLKLDDGFTHCFLLTFKDEAGREVYLPHPDHKAFGALLRPHLDKVFVIDYWGTPHAQPKGNELTHMVFLKFKHIATAADIREVEESFAALPKQFDAIKSFEWGKNNSPETHDDGFTHAFMMTFDSDAARDKYLAQPEHEAFVGKIFPFLDKVRVLDFWTKEDEAARTK